MRAIDKTLPMSMWTHLVRADLVHHVPIGGDTVGAEQHDIHLVITGTNMSGGVPTCKIACSIPHLALQHEQARSIVSDQMHGHADTHELPGRQPGALKAWSRFIHPNVDVFALRMAFCDGRAGDGTKGMEYERHRAP